MLRAGIDTLLAGDVDTGRPSGDYIKATMIGFEKLGEATATGEEPHP